MSIARPYFKTLKNVAVLLPLKLPYFNELLYSLNHRKNNKVKWCYPDKEELRNVKPLNIS